jgi:CheY-like chemotaxis protein
VEAVNQVHTPDFDVVFCDLMMADVDGVPWHQYLSQRWPNVASRLVVMTGGAFSPLARDFAIENAKRLVEKPFDVVAEVNQRRMLGSSRL